MERQIFIENLYPDVDAYLLCRDFRQFGNILSVSIDYDDQFVSLMKGQIVFQKPSSAKAALKMNGQCLYGRPLVVKLAGGKPNLRKINRIFTKIFVKNFDLSWDDLDLEQKFENFGEVVHVEISKTDGKSNGYGFVTFKEHTSAEKAAKEMNDKVFGEKVLRVEPYLPKDVREGLNSKSLDHAKDMLVKATQLNNLHVKNLPKSTDEKELRKLFEVFGEVTSVKIARDDSQNSRGFGFVCFKNEKDAETALFRMKDYSFHSNILEVNYNQSKEQRQHYLQLVKTENQQKKPFKEFNKKPPGGKSVESGTRHAAPLFSFSMKR
ncbi:uncharacterized protein [Parasteatoda tepidariorum]|uniref:uncharacterized protein n=1 Tax=Parasteatoda tepidariorum TaxID=114398 RepID=UPI00077FE147|nr:polyadenylate-binding protein, cytoplasmic and nuclear [Parasteatoda tepidariorum]